MCLFRGRGSETPYCVCGDRLDGGPAWGLTVQTGCVQARPESPAEQECWCPPRSCPAAKWPPRPLPAHPPFLGRSISGRDSELVEGRPTTVHSVVVLCPHRHRAAAARPVWARPLKGSLGHWRQMSTVGALEPCEVFEAPRMGLWPPGSRGEELMVFGDFPYAGSLRLCPVWIGPAAAAWRGELPGPPWGTPPEDRVPVGLGLASLRYPALLGCDDLHPGFPRRYPKVTFVWLKHFGGCVGS